ncbi:MAG: hypothetical protein H7843_06885 [Nitrospirota bacterium]
MKRAASIIVMAVFLLSSVSTAFAGYVSGYYTKKGTYVKGHYRSGKYSSKKSKSPGYKSNRGSSLR